MKKRVLCFLTAAILALLPWAAPAEEDDEECRHEHKDTVRYVAPAVGVPGYSGDYACLDCGFVFQKGDVIPAVDEPVGAVMAGSQDDNDGNDTDGLIEPAVIPAASDPEPETPVQTEIQTQTELQVQAETQTQTELQVQAETQIQLEPQVQKQAETPPEVPITVSESQAETQTVQAETLPETPPEAPILPATVSTSEAEPQSEAVEAPVVIQSIEEPAAEAVPAPVPEPLPDPIPAEAPAQAAESAPQTSGRNGSSRQPRRDSVSEKYPFRRVKMNPEPGIRAEAAGTLLWPKAVSPLQQMAGD